MQWIAMYTMLIDHVGLLFFPQSEIWRVVGRLAFPIYAYCIIAGMDRTRNMKAYMLRLLLIAIVAQGAFIALGEFRLNIVFAFVIAVCIFRWMDRLRHRWQLFSVALLASAVFEFGQLEYGAYGFILLCIYRYANGWFMVLLHLALNLSLGYFLFHPIQVFSIVSTILIVLIPKMFSFRPPAWLWRTFYPGHLAILAALQFIVNR